MSFAEECRHIAETEGAAYLDEVERQRIAAMNKEYEDLKEKIKADARKGKRYYAYRVYGGNEKIFMQRLRDEGLDVSTYDYRSFGGGVEISAKF